jgi:6-pyruvoyl-tetrahydropterin synthase
MEGHSGESMDGLYAARGQDTDSRSCIAGIPCRSWNGRQILLHDLHFRLMSPSDQPGILPLFPNPCLVDNASHYQTTASIMRLFVNQLTVMDFSCLHPSRGLVGESWQVDIELQGGLDEQGMVLDFSDVKRRVKQLIDERFDHRLLIPADHTKLEVEGDRISFIQDNGLRIRHQGPPEAVQFIPGKEITPASTARAIQLALEPELPDNVLSVQLTLSPETDEGAWYQYSHGLKLHCGNCQRIAHGHRSRIRIWRDGVRDEVLEQSWAGLLRDIYIGTESDLVAITSWNDQSCFRFAYTAEQGDFELELAAERCYLINTESTVENIARHIREHLEAGYPGNRFRVQAFEGIGKGAISESSV